MNSFNGIGNVGKDATLNYTQNSTAMCKFSVAIESGFGDNKKTTWFACTLWGKRAESVHPYILKGTKVGISGEIALDTWQSDQGERSIVACNLSDVTFCAPPKNGGQQQPRQQQQPAQKPAQQAAPPSDVNYEDDIPFAWALIPGAGVMGYLMEFGNVAQTVL
jgi:single-strand DNA-binding protein